MWVRDLLFFGLGLSGLAALSTGLLSEQRIEPPAEYRAAFQCRRISKRSWNWTQSFSSTGNSSN